MDYALCISLVVTGLFVAVMKVSDAKDRAGVVATGRLLLTAMALAQFVAAWRLWP